MVGLGKMGANMTRRLISGGHDLVVYDRNAEALASAERDGAIPTQSLEDLADRLTPPRCVWVMVPSGEPTEATIARLAAVLEPGDAIRDGGNSNKDTVRRAARLIQALAPAPDRVGAQVGPSGAGHFVKMVHNRVEYGLVEAYAEGFNLMRHKEEFGLDIAQVAGIWRHGSVVRSWLLAARALSDNPNLEDVVPYVHDSGEGRWTVAEAIEVGVAIPVITSALEQRFGSREAENFGHKMLNALRNQSGGHELGRRTGSE